MDYKKLPKVIEQKADDMLERAENEELVHGLLSLLPAGGFLDSVLFRRIKQRARKRLEEFHLVFAKQLSDLDENKIDKDFLDSEEFDTLVMKVVARIVWEHSVEKRAFLRAVLLNSITVDFSRNPLKETILELLNEISPAHIKVLDAFSKNMVRENTGFNSVSDLVKVINGMQEVDADAITYDLFKKGVLDREPEEFHRTFEISGLGKCLLAFINEPKQ